MIEAPNLTRLSADYNNGPPTPALLLFRSWLRRQSLDQPRQYDITIRPTCIRVCVVPKGNGSGLSEGPKLFLSLQRAISNNAMIEILEEAERLIPPCAAVTMDSDDMHGVADYLKTPRVEKNGTQSWPLRNLHSVHFKLKDALRSFGLVSDFARTRRDVALITTDAEGPYGAGRGWNKWDEASRSLIPIQRPVDGTIPGSLEIHAVGKVYNS